MRSTIPSAVALAWLIIVSSGISPAAAGPLVNGVAAGDVSQETVVLWARAGTAGTLTFEVSTDAGFGQLTGNAVSTTVGNSAMPSKVSLSGLQPGTQYFYRATDTAGNQSTGTFRTAQPQGVQAGLSFGVSGDWLGGLSPYPSIGNAAGKNLDFFVALGDTIYGDVPSPAVAKAQATTVEDFRAKHAEPLTQKFGRNTVVDLRQSTSVFALPDDHEVTDNYAGGAHPSTDARFKNDPAAASPGAKISDTALFKNGMQVFGEYQPIQDKTWSGTGDSRVDGKPDFYRTQSFGKDASIFLVDARSFRDAPLDRSGALGTSAGFLQNSLDPARTMLGNPQLQRLKDDLLKAQKDGQSWKFIMLPEPIQNFGPAGGEDRYEGYAAERNALLKFIDENKIANVVFITADIHGTVVNNLTYQDDKGQTKPVAAWEISTGSVAVTSYYNRVVLDGLKGAIQQLKQLGTPEALAQAAQLEQLLASYGFLPAANDKDSLVNDQNDLIKSLINQQLALLGYDSIGLDGAPGIDASLLQGDYLAGNTYGWSQFAIDPKTQTLTVTTYGIPTYDDIGPNSLALASESQIVSQFAVAPTLVDVNEPATLGLLGLGLLGLAALNRRRAPR